MHRFKEEWDWYLMGKTLDLLPMEGKRIIVENRKIVTNWRGLRSVILETSLRANPPTLATRTSEFKNTPHQGFLDKDKYGCSYTHSTEVRINKQEVPTLESPLPKIKDEQYAVYGYFDENLGGTSNFNTNFLKNHGIHNPKTLEGLLMRTWIFTLTTETDRILFQGSGYSKIELLNHKIPLYYHGLIGKLLTNNSNRGAVDNLIKNIRLHENR